MADGLAKKERHRKKMRERRQAKKLTDQGTPLALLHLEPQHMTKHITDAQLRDLVYYSVLADSPPLPFCHITRNSLVQRLVILFVDDFDITWMGVPVSRTDVPTSVDLASVSNDAVAKANMPHLTSIFSHMLITNLRVKSMRYSTKPIAGLIQSPLTLNRKDQIKTDLEKRAEETKGDKYQLFSLSLEDMRKAGYPIPPSLDASVSLQDEWKETRPGSGAPKRLMAVDCEMVLTTQGRELARVSIVGEDGEVVLDEFVKPENPILDYLTEFSGITKDIMDQTQCSLRRAQKHVRKLIDHDVLLVGHSLDMDLNALKLAHPCCADTSLLYDSPRGPPFQPSLRGLTKAFLKRAIQINRHDSVQDAKASLDLFQLKVQRGIKFGRHGLPMELIFDRLKRQDGRDSLIMQSLAPARPSTFQSGLGNLYQRHDSDDALVAAVVDQCKNQHLLLAQTQGCSIYEQNAEDDDDSGGDGLNTTVPPMVLSYNPNHDPAVAKRVAKLDDYIHTIYQALPLNTAFMVLGGIGQNQRFQLMLKKYLAFEQRRKSKTTVGEPIDWTVEEQKELDELYGQMRKGACFFTLKK
ncbi:hypothetical protein DM01DRAFT_313361 [Hesseltinella vesiculosa]|uniref:Exonuclease domain-containing protein n=1 Tax=Hesseltinella vesiculosa TaxID=101127 RepID=A0A1X2GVK6_9FUNG|nr:hypothetical protein DM01DRAFT_313361 [Hesseltinella vesiculosa]